MVDARTLTPARGAVHEARATLRRPVRLRARMRGQGATRFDIDVLDLSTSGFRAETMTMLRPGATVWLTLPGLSGLAAVIAWTRGDQIGARFDQPLHPAVFEHIVELGR